MWIIQGPANRRVSLPDPVLLLVVVISVVKVVVAAAVVVEVKLVAVVYSI
jgi:hypothetical protein